MTLAWSVRGGNFRDRPAATVQIESFRVFLLHICTAPMGLRHAGFFTRPRPGAGTNPLSGEALLVDFPAAPPGWHAAC
jgi:hypothetical protein